MGHGSPSKFHSSILLRRLQRLQTSHRGRLALLQQSAQRPAQCRASAAAPTAEAAVAEKPESAESATQTAARWGGGGEFRTHMGCRCADAEDSLFSLSILCAIVDKVEIS